MQGLSYAISFERPFLHSSKLQECALRLALKFAAFSVGPALDQVSVLADSVVAGPFSPDPVSVCPVSADFYRSFFDSCSAAVAGWLFVADRNRHRLVRFGALGWPVDFHAVWRCVCADA